MKGYIAEYKELISLLYIYYIYIYIYIYIYKRSAPGASSTLVTSVVPTC